MRGCRLALLALLVVAGFAGCDSGGTECQCGAAGLTVSIPSGLATDVYSIVPIGLACTNAVVDPTPGPNVRAAQYHVTPTQTGPCHLDIDLTDGTTFSDDVVVIQTTGCCAGLRTDPPGAAEITVPPPIDASSLYREGGDD